MEFLHLFHRGHFAGKQTTSGIAKCDQFSQANFNKYHRCFKFIFRLFDKLYNVSLFSTLPGFHGKMCIISKVVTLSCPLVCKWVNFSCGICFHYLQGLPVLCLPFWILFQAQLGVFEEHLDDNIVAVLLDAGVLFLLRWALDDSSDAVIAAAIQCFAAILIVPSDKVCMIINPVTPRQINFQLSFSLKRWNLNLVSQVASKPEFFLAKEKMSIALATIISHNFEPCIQIMRSKRTFTGYTGG